MPRTPAQLHRPSIAVLSIAFILSGAITLHALAQTTSGTVVGTVYDKSGKGMPSALVIAANEVNGFRQTARSSDTGSYSIPNLPQGYYTLTARKQGFIDDTIAHFAVQFDQKNAVRLPKLTLHTVTLVGKVVDRAGNPLPDAEVLVTDRSNGASRAASTNQYGHYAVSDLPTGDYIVTASYGVGAGSFDESVSVALDKKLTGAPTIKIVEALSTAQNPPQPQPAAPVLEESKFGALVHIFDAARTTNFTERQIVSLPLGGSTYMRTVDDLALLAAGVAPPPFTPGVHGPGVGFGIGTAGQFSVNGMRARSNNFSVDGSDNNDSDVGVRRQGFVALVPQPIESVMEVSISTLLWDAELGRNFGSQVNAVSKYGANKYHGQGFGFLTDSRLNSRNFFDYTGGPSGDKDPLTRTQAGFAIGGPLIADRAQFFGSFEHQQINASTETHFSTPTQTERSFSDQFGSLPAGSTQVIGPFSGTTPLGKNVLSLYPLPNDPGGPFGANTFTEVLPANGRGNELSFRVSERVRANHSLDARYNLTDDGRVLPSVNRAIRSTLEAKTRSQNLSLIFNSAFWTRAYNLARFSFGRTRLSFSDYPGSPFIFSSSSKETVKAGASDVVLPSQTGPVGELVIEPFSPVGVDVFTFPQRRSSNTFQYADTLSLVSGEHMIKLGGNVRRYQLNSVLDRLYRPQVVYSGGLLLPGNLSGNQFISSRSLQPISGVQLAGLGIPSSVLQTITLGAPDSTIGLRFNELHFFVNDTWRIKPNLSLDYGLRYEYNTVPRDANNRIERALGLAGLPAAGGSRFDTGKRTRRFNAAVDAYKQILDGRERIYEPDANNFGPHAGIAWDPAGNGRVAVRAGYGVYYDTVLGAVVSQSRNVFPNEIPINVDPSVLAFDLFSLNNPAFLQVTRDGQGNFTNPVSLLQPAACNQFGACNRFGGSTADFVALIGELFRQNQIGGGLAFTLPEKNLRTPYAGQWHVTIEGELFDDYFFSAAYVGTKGTKLTRLTSPNLGPNVTPIISIARSFAGAKLSFPVILNSILGSAFVGGRPNSNVGAYQVFENSAASNYHALQLEARKRYSQGFQFTASYTWSHAIDDVSDVFPIAGAPTLPQNSFDLRAERASASFDVRHRFAGSVVWDLPFFRNSKNGARPVLGGWQIASIIQGHTGQPFTLNVPFDANFDGNLSDRPSTTAGLIFFDNHGPRRVALALGRAATDFFTITKEGSVGRNTARGDGFINMDLAMSKRFQLSERHALDVRAEVFNVANRANFGLPIRTIGAPGFGSAVETSAPARVIQVALKYSF
jgi:hypothetical protein